MMMTMTMTYRVCRMTHNKVGWYNGAYRGC